MTRTHATTLYLLLILYLSGIPPSAAATITSFTQDSSHGYDQWMASNSPGHGGSYLHTPVFHTDSNCSLSINNLRSCNALGVDINNGQNQFLRINNTSARGVGYYEQLHSIKISSIEMSCRTSSEKPPTLFMDLGTRRYNLGKWMKHNVVRRDTVTVEESVTIDGTTTPRGKIVIASGDLNYLGGPAESKILLSPTHKGAPPLFVTWKKSEGSLSWDWVNPAAGTYLGTFIVKLSMS